MTRTLTQKQVFKPLNDVTANWAKIKEQLKSIVSESETINLLKELDKKKWL